MRKVILFFALLAFLLVPTSAQAQSAIHLSSVTVEILPEYDQPAVLTIYHITLAAGTVLPASLVVRIPQDGSLNAVATSDSTNNLLNAPYDEAVKGQWREVTVSVPKGALQVQVESYSPLVKNGTSRHIVFVWSSDYAVDSLDVNFLRPQSATGVTISQATVSTSPGLDGLTNYLIQSINLTPGEPFNLTIDYQRQTDTLGNAGQLPQAVSTPGPDTPGRVSMTGILPWILGGIGVLLILAGIVGFVFWQRGGREKQVIRKHRSPRKENEETTGTEAEDIYCHQCGKRAQPGDVFCRTCGTRLRKAGAE